MQLAYFKLILAAFFWGSSAIAGKILFASAFPSQVSFLRFFLAFCFLGVFLMATEKHYPHISLAEHFKLALLGIVGIALCYYFYFKGLYRSSAFNAGMIEATIPLVTLLLSVLIGEEKFELENAVGFIVAYMGVVVIITKMDISIIIDASYDGGDILLLLSTLCFGLYNILVRKCQFQFKSQYIKYLSVNNTHLSEGDDRRCHMQQCHIGVCTFFIAHQ